MGRIQASTGLITGIPIQDTIDKLIQVAAQPRVLLENRLKGLQSQKLAVSQLTALVIGVGFSMRQLASQELYSQTSVSSTNPELLSATATGSPAENSYQYTPVRKSSSHQLLSQGFASKSSTLGAGELSVQFGGAIDKGVALDQLNGGVGVQRGKIRITDRAGNSATVDLRLAVTIDDVLQAINENNDVEVTAITDGDRIRLIDRTGQSVSNLRVQEVGSSSTAADLGLSGINVAADEALGSDILRLFDGLQLQRLNDGNGVALSKSVTDLQVGLRDGTTLEIDFLALKKGDTEASGVTNAQNGVDAQVRITSTGIGSAFDGFKLTFQDDDTVTVGGEKVNVDSVRKTITVKIDAGHTRSADIVAALNASEAFQAKYTASLGDGNGNGLIELTDTLTTSGGAPEYYQEQTIGQLLETINRADPAKLEARISASGDSLELVDLTAGASSFTVTSLFGGSVAADLGFSSPAVDGVLTATRRFSGLKTVLLDSLNGGQGLGTLGDLSITNRQGSQTIVDLSSARTLEDVIHSINQADTGITASINGARNGLLLTDTTGGTGNLVIANGDANNTADKLRIAADTTLLSVNSGSLNLQSLSRSQSLSSLRHGQGIGTGSFLVTDSLGQTGAVNLAVLGATTVGDVIDGINALGLGAQARINDTGDGLLLVDTAGGSGSLVVSDAGNGTAASDLKIAGTSTLKTIDGNPTQVIDGSLTVRVTLDSDDTLQDLVSKLNAAQGDFQASLWNGGGGYTPFRLALNSQIQGAAGELVVDGSGLGLNLFDTSPAQDALLLAGSLDSPIAGALISSPSNSFSEVIEGVDLTLNESSTAPVTVSVAKSGDSIISQVKLFVGQYNKLQDKLGEVATYNPEDNTAGVLFSSTEVLQIDLAFGAALTTRYRSAGDLQSFDAIGVSLDGQGRLQFDEQKFRQQYAKDPAAIQQFFATAGSGAAAKIQSAADRLSGTGNSVLVNRALALQRAIDDGQKKIDAIDLSLERQRELLLTQFSRLEDAVAKMQSNLSYLSQIQSLKFGYTPSSQTTN